LGKTQGDHEVLVYVREKGVNTCLKKVLKKEKIILIPICEIFNIFIINIFLLIMPVGNRKYENTLQYAFGLVMLAILAQCLINSLMTLFSHLFRR